MKGKSIEKCDYCGRVVYEFRDHLPRCPALGKEARR
jgi:predicted  nucleic acid-binding Zn-ribbon protein